jgi:hypothetical protein
VKAGGVAKKEDPKLDLANLRSVRQKSPAYGQQRCDFEFLA